MLNQQRSLEQNLYVPIHSDLQNPSLNAIGFINRSLFIVRLYQDKNAENDRILLEIQNRMKTILSRSISWPQFRVTVKEFPFLIIVMLLVLINMFIAMFYMTSDSTNDTAMQYFYASVFIVLAYCIGFIFYQTGFIQPRYIQFIEDKLSQFVIYPSVEGVILQRSTISLNCGCKTIEVTDKITAIRK